MEPNSASGALLKLQSERMLKKAQEAERKAREAEEKTQGQDRETEEDTLGSKPQAGKDVRRINTEWSLAFSKNNINCLIKLKSLVMFF